MKGTTRQYLFCATALALVAAPLALPGSVFGQIATNAGATRPLTRILVLGDSFAADRSFQQRLQELLPDTAIRFDAVGGSSLADQLQRLALNPVGDGEALLILDGGLTDKSPVDTVAAMAATLDDSCRVWLYIEPVQRAVPQNYGGGPRWTMQEQRVAAVEERFPSHVVRVMNRLRALPLRAEGDRSDVENGWVARSYRRDRVHLNAMGFGELAQLVADALKRAADVPC